jgi:hypothetical protein
MRERLAAVVIGAAMASVYWPSAASAQSTSFGAILATSAGASDNINLAPRTVVVQPGQENQPQALALRDGFTSISPTLILTSEGRRAVLIASYTLFAQLYFQNDSANSYTNTADLAALFLVSRRARLGFIANISQGQTSTFPLVVPGGGVEATRAGSLPFLSYQLGQNFAYDVEQRWRFDQSLTARSFVPLQGQPLDTTDLNLLTSGTRLWRRTSVFLRYQTEYFMNFIPGGQQQLVTGPSLGLRRDFLDSWSAEADGGAVAITAPNKIKLTGVHIEPTALAALRFRRERNQIEATYTHAPLPNLQVGQMFINDTVNLNASYRIFREPGVLLGGDIGATRSREVSVMDNSIGGQSYIYFADAAVSFAINENLDFALRYLYRKQVADPGSSLISYTANTGLVTLIGRYPGNASRRTPNLRRAFRVDGSDVQDPFEEQTRKASAKEEAIRERR